MKIERRLVKFAEAKELIQKQVADVKAGNADLKIPLKKNLDTIGMFKGISVDGVIGTDVMIPLELEATITAEDTNTLVISEISSIKKQLDGIQATMAKEGPGETEYLLERVIWKMRDRMSDAQVALDAIQFARAIDAAASQGQTLGGDKGMEKSDFSKLLDFDSILEEVGQEAMDVVKKMLDKVKKAEGDDDGGADGDGDAPGDAADGDAGDASGDTAGGDDDGDDDDKSTPKAEPNQKSDDDSIFDSIVDLSPPLNAPKNKDDNDLGVEIEE